MALADIFLKLDAVDGESKDSKHKGEIDILSFSWGVTQAGIGGFGGGSGAGKASFADLTVVKRADKSSTILAQKCTKGDHIKTGLLTVRKAGGTQEEYYTIKLGEILISSFQNAGSGEDAIPIENVSLNFSKIEFNYKEQKDDGSLGGGTPFKYDIKANT